MPVVCQDPVFLNSDELKSWKYGKSFHLQCNKDTNETTVIFEFKNINVRVMLIVKENKGMDNEKSFPHSEITRLQSIDFQERTGIEKRCFLM